MTTKPTHARQPFLFGASLLLQMLLFGALLFIGLVAYVPIWLSLFGMLWGGAGDLAALKGILRDDMPYVLAFGAGALLLTRIWKQTHSWKRRLVAVAAIGVVCFAIPYLLRETILRTALLGMCIALQECL